MTIFSQTLMIMILLKWLIYGLLSFHWIGVLELFPEMLIGLISFPFRAASTATNRSDAPSVADSKNRSVTPPNSASFSSMT